MNLNTFPEDIRNFLLPQRQRGVLFYECLGCQRTYNIEKLLYTCPDCGSVLLIQDAAFEEKKAISGETWQKIFDFRKSLKISALSGVYRFHEFIGPEIPMEDIVWLGEAATPVIEASFALQERVGARFFFKNDGQNPSGSFKDRGMASAYSCLNYLIKSGRARDILAVCASTGDTSASAALYAAYLKPKIKLAVLLPHNKVTPQQLSQPLGNGATVFEIPGVFDDCMKIVEELSETYNVALLNSKNAWRILGQESYSYEVAQDFSYDVGDKVIVVPVGNAGNIAAVMNGFLKFQRTGIINALPKILGVQSEHANPVSRYYRENDPKKRRFQPVSVQPSVAQAAMIGNPVSMPRVVHLAQEYDRAAGRRRVFVTEVTEQEIMDWHLIANNYGNIVCTHGGECLAGLVAAGREGLVSAEETAVLYSTAHALKFSNFQEMYFENKFPAEYNVIPDPDLVNQPQLLATKDVRQTTQEIATRLNLSKVTS